MRVLYIIAFAIGASLCGCSPNGAAKAATPVERATLASGRYTLVTRSGVGPDDTQQTLAQLDNRDGQLTLTLLEFKNQALVGRLDGDTVELAQGSLVLTGKLGPSGAVEGTLAIDGDDPDNTAAFKLIAID